MVISEKQYCDLESKSQNLWCFKVCLSSSFQATRILCTPKCQNKNWCTPRYNFKKRHQWRDYVNNFNIIFLLKETLLRFYVNEMFLWNRLVSILYYN